MSKNNNKALVLENGFQMDIPEELIRILERNKIEWEWFDMRERFWKENREETLKYFAGLPEGQELYCHTVFDGYGQLELMIELLHHLKEKKFSFKIMNASLCDGLIDWFDNKQADYVPEELNKQLEDLTLTDEECDEIYEKIDQHKRDLNQKFIEVLQLHNIYWLHSYKAEETQLTSIEDIKANCYE